MSIPGQIAGTKGSFAAGSDAAVAFYRTFFRLSPILPSQSKSRKLVKMGHDLVKMDTIKTRSLTT